jgi:hypothetical protein
MPHLEDADGKHIDIPMPEGPFEPSPPLALWWSLSRPDGGGAHMRLALEDRWKITDVYVHGRDLGATDIQAVPITELDLLVNLTDEFGGFDPASIADAYNEMATLQGWGPGVLYVDPDSGEDDEPSFAQLRELAVNAPGALHAPAAAERPRLTRPDGTDPDGFAARVAAAYREYALKTRAVAVEMAQEADVPVPTARSWIREARRRGKLPQGRPGRTG